MQSLSLNLVKTFLYLFFISFSLSLSDTPTLFCWTLLSKNSFISCILLVRTFVIINLFQFQNSLFVLFCWSCFWFCHTHTSLWLILIVSNGSLSSASFILFLVSNVLTWHFSLFHLEPSFFVRLCSFWLNDFSHFLSLFLTLKRFLHCRLYNVRSIHFNYHFQWPGQFYLKYSNSPFPLSFLFFYFFCRLQLFVLSSLPFSFLLFFLDLKLFFSPFKLGFAWQRNNYCCPPPHWEGERKRERLKKFENSENHPVETNNSGKCQLRSNSVAVGVEQWPNLSELRYFEWFEEKEEKTKEKKLEWKC